MEPELKLFSELDEEQVVAKNLLDPKRRFTIEVSTDDKENWKQPLYVPSPAKADSSKPLQEKTNLTVVDKAIDKVEKKEKQEISNEKVDKENKDPALQASGELSIYFVDQRDPQTIGPFPNSH